MLWGGLPNTCYTNSGTIHQEPCGKLFSGALNRPSLLFPARKGRHDLEQHPD